ncbi:GL24293 [Drosophila persimilis]|uniref:GCS light chain n=1 Tax=Drosophila persimilis TaxID=7234 RepID=B4G542_DROPE|nr:GL24293 [Drosophila persimilis]
MATWTQNEPTGVSKRRRWNLEDRASLNKLKNHIAQEGCPQMQYDLAKQILDNAIAESTTAAPAVKSPCSEANPAPSSVSNWSARNGAQGVIELKELYRSLEQYALNQKITQLGIADLDAEALAELHKSAAVAPTIAQVNLSTCCRVPTELQEFCAAHDIQLNTHGDPELLLPEEQFSGLAPGYTIDWSLRYQVHVRCRGVLTAKGYIVGASRPIPSASTSAKASA